VLLFALQLEQTPLSGTFPAFPVRDGFIIPLGELCRQLDLAVQTDPAKGLASGFLLDESRRFSLDVLAGIATAGGVRLPVDRSRVELHGDDIYVDTRLLSQWLPLDFRVDPRAAVITVIPREPLPLQLRWKRERDQGRARNAPAPPSFTREPSPYRLWEVPMVDETLRITGRSEPGAGRALSGQSTTFATGDFLYLSTSLYAVLDSHQGFPEFRMALGRRDPLGGLLGPLDATEFAFGDVLDPGLNLLSLPYSGTGALVTNFPLQRENAFDRHSFQGALPPGWQVELYRNQALVGFQGSRADGRYEFLNVPLYYGWNDFRLVFYGPQGQRREEVAHFDVSESQTPEGAFQYRLVGADPATAGKRAQLEGRYGFSRQLAMDLNVATLDLDGVRHTYTQAALHGFWKPLSGSLSAATDSAGGSIAETGLRTRLGTWSLSARQAELRDGFVSEVFRPVYGRVRRRSTLEASALLPSLERAWFTLDLGGSRDQLVSGGTVDRLTSRLSTSYGGYFLSNQVNRTQGRGADLAFPATTTGDFLASKYFRGFSLRGQAEYQISGARRFNALSVTAETPLLRPFLLRAGFTHAVANHESIVQLGANKTQGAYSLGLDLSWSNRSRLTADLVVRVGLGRDPRSRKLYTQAQTMATFGAVSARAFLDTNGNGVKDPGEKPLEGVGFLVNGAQQPRRTDAHGLAYLNNLSGDMDANLSLATSTLEDPLMRPGRPGVRITPRQGHVREVDLPVIILGEATGTAFVRRDGGVQELPGLRLELLDAAGKPVRTLRTGFDGFFDATELPAGTYQLRVDPQEAQRLGLAPPKPRSLVIGAEGTLLDGQDFILEAPAGKPAASPSLPPAP
jgi:hypothetical protein